MAWTSNGAVTIALALLFGLGQAGCNTRTPGADDAAPPPVDSGVQTGTADTAATPTEDSTVMSPPADTMAARVPDTSAATPPIIPPSRPARDTPPAAAKPGKPTGEAEKSGGLKVSRLEYEGWRQYSVNCARCHGQDVLPNPVAANLLVSLGSGGPIDTPEKFLQVVSKGRPERGMPAFGSLLTPEQINAMYAYVKGRAEGRIPPGRPDSPGA
jgi:mono/diheme cytochrome c family protein